MVFRIEDIAMRRENGMYRLTLCRTSKERVRVRAKGGYERLIYVPDNEYRKYYLVVGLKGCFRDLLFRDFGIENYAYRRKEIEHEKSITKSLVSAVRRMGGDAYRS